LMTWVNRGGRLVLDDDGDLSALPEEWRPTDSTYALAGRGEVRIREGMASSAKWAEIIDPSGSVPSTDGEQRQFGGDGSYFVQQELARRSGVRLPKLAPVMIPLVIYALSSSLVLFVVLKVVRRMTLAWVAIPALAVLTAVAIGLFGSRWRSAGEPTATAVVDSSPGGAVAQLSVLTFSRSGDTVRVSVPSGWHSDGEANPSFGASATPYTTATGDGTEFSASLEPGQVISTTLSGPVPDIGLRVEASTSADGRKVSGTVTNGSTVVLEDVAVFTRGGAVAIDTLAPGTSEDFSINAAPLPGNVLITDRVWVRDFDGTAADDSLVQLGAWEIAASSHNLYPSGVVRAAGWTDELPSATLTVKTRTAVSTTANITNTGNVLHSASVRASIVRSPMNGNGADDFVARYAIPAGPATASPLVIEMPIGIRTVELWNGAAWVDVKVEDREAAVPAAAVRDGVVLLRITNDNGEFFLLENAPLLRGEAGR
jgi:hypothetical protein